MKISEILLKNDEQLKEDLLNLKKESFNLRFRKISNQVTDTSRFSVVRKTIAKIKTVLNQRKAVNGAKNA